MYAAHINQDLEEDRDKWQNYIEYLASFWDSQAVQKVKDARENEIKVDEDEFGQQLEGLFGHSFDSNAEQINRRRKV